MFISLRLRKGPTAADELSVVDSDKWIAELTQPQKNVESNDAAIRRKAAEFVNAVDDPKFANSKVCSFSQFKYTNQVKLLLGFYAVCEPVMCE